MAKERLKSPRARLFVALDLPDEVLDGVASWQRRELDEDTLRPLRRESLHITLAFLGYHPERSVDDIAAAALDVEPRTVTMTLRPEPVPVPGPGRPRLFALAAESEAAVEIQQEVSDSLQGAGFYEPEKRPFWTHITICRVRGEKRGSRRLKRVKEPPGPLPDALLEPFDAVRIALYRSYLRPTGAEYVAMAQRGLPSRIAR